jgi:hypothetical protein
MGLQTQIPPDAVAKRLVFTRGPVGIRNEKPNGCPAPGPSGSVTNMPVRVSAVRNDYRCSIERNQGGKYCVRIRVRYPRHAWLLGVFFLASSFDKAMKKLEESLDFLQRHEEKLWFWGVDRAEDMGFSVEFLREAGLRLDRRVEFPPKGANLTLPPERSVPAFVLGPVRRGLAESMEAPRMVHAAS